MRKKPWKTPSPEDVFGLSSFLEPGSTLTFPYLLNTFNAVMLFFCSNAKFAPTPQEENRMLAPVARQLRHDFNSLFSNVIGNHTKYSYQHLCSRCHQPRTDFVVCRGDKVCTRCIKPTDTCTTLPKVGTRDEVVTNYTFQAFDARRQVHLDAMIHPLSYTHCYSGSHNVFKDNAMVRMWEADNQCDQMALHMWTTALNAYDPTVSRIAAAASLYEFNITDDRMQLKKKKTKMRMEAFTHAASIKSASKPIFISCPVGIHYSYSKGDHQKGHATPVVITIDPKSKQINVILADILPTPEHHCLSVILDDVHDSIAACFPKSWKTNTQLMKSRLLAACRLNTFATLLQFHSTWPRANIKAPLLQCDRPLPERRNLNRGWGFVMNRFLATFWGILVSIGNQRAGPRTPMKEYLWQTLVEAQHCTVADIGTITVAKDKKTGLLRYMQGWDTATGKIRSVLQKHAKGNLSPKFADLFNGKKRRPSAKAVFTKLNQPYMDLKASTYNQTIMESPDRSPGQKGTSK